MARTQKGSPLNARLPAYALPLVLAVGGAVRLAHLSALRRSPLWDVLQWDAKTYDDWALEIAGGAWVGARAFWQDPLYAYLLGALYRLLGHDLWIPRLFALGCGVATAWLVARIARRAWGSRRVALGAALAFGLFLPAVHYEAIVGKTALSLFLLALAVERFLGWSDRSLLAAGASLGCAVLTRGNLLVLLPLAALAIAGDWLEPSKTRREPTVRARRVGWLCAGAVPVLLLATLHNFLAVREFVPITTNLGINLYLGNHADNAHGYYTPPPFLPANASTEIPSFREEAVRRGGGELDDYALSRFWTRETVRAVAADPGRVLGLWFDKARLLLIDDEVSDADSIELVAEFSPVLRLPLLGWGQVLPFALLGAVIGFRRRKPRTLTIVAAAYALSLLPFFMLGRLRVSVVPISIVLAAGGVRWLWQTLEKRDRPALARAAALVLAGFAASYLRAPWMEKTNLIAPAVNWNNLGSALVDKGDVDGAIHAYTRAVELDAEAVPLALRALAALHEQRGELPAAVRALDRLVELKPQSASAQASLRRVRAALVGGNPAVSAAASSAAAAWPAVDAPLAPIADWTLSDAARAALVARLAQETGAKLYLRFDGRDAAARALARSLAAAGSEAGWQIADHGEANVALRPGLFLFAATGASSSYQAVKEGLERAGFNVNAGTDYRAFVAGRQQEDPSYRGLSFAPGQDYVLAVGRPP